MDLRDEMLNMLATTHTEERFSSSSMFPTAQRPRP